MSFGQLANRSEISERDRLAAARVIRDRHHHQGNPLRSLPPDQGLQSFDVEVTFKRKTSLGIRRFPNRQIDGLSPHEFDVRPRGIEMGIVWDYLTWLTKAGE